jgi:predicted TIM-barrel fold metal-dependent hydrolase
MKIDAHGHGMHAELNAGGRRIPPLMSAWRNTELTPAEHIKQHNELGIEKVLLLDPIEVTFELKQIFGDFVLPCPMVLMEESSPEEIASLLDRGACGIKFIAPMHPYGDDRYLPLYEVIRDYHALAVFHTGYLVHNFFDPGGVLPRPSWININHMRPAELDRINRAFPDLKILMAHFGNPWWEEAWTMLKSNNNIYADLSGGTAYEKSMGLWKDLFAPNGKLNTKIVSKLCYAADDSMFSPGYFGYEPFIEFYDKLYDELQLPEEIRRKIDRENILMLTDRK